MKILLVSATNPEIWPLLRKMKKNSSDGVLSGYRFGKHPVDVLVTGIGMTLTAFHLGRYLNNKYDLAINAGVAGSFTNKIPPGTVVNVTHDCFADLGAEDGHQFLTLKEIGLNQENKITSSIIRHPSSTLRRLPKVKGITVNTVHGNEKSVRNVVKKFNPDVESMEGAAFSSHATILKRPVCRYAQCPTTWSGEIRKIGN